MWLVLTGSYLFCDAIDVYRIWGMNKEMMAHHFIGIIGVLASVWVGIYVGIVSEAFLLTELSSFFLNVMFCMKILKKEEEYPNMKKYNSLSLVISYVLVRIIYVAYLEFAKIIPAMLEYDWKKWSPIVGTFKLWFSCALIAPMLLLIFLNIYWAHKIYRGYKKSLTD